MSTSRAKQRKQGKRPKTKLKGNGAKYSWARNKKMRRGPKNLWYSNNSRRRR